MPHLHEYAVAWTIYVVSGTGICVVWWKLTARYIPYQLLREFVRGLAVVAIFTPWFTTPGGHHYAPASLVLLIDLTLQGARGGLKGGVALLFMLFVMIAIMILRRLNWRSRR